jgi:hypothetical protein
MKAKDMTVAIVDYGTFGPSIAERFARDCKQTILYCPRSSGFPGNDRDLIGTGIPGVTKVLEEEFFALIPGIDLFIFPFLGMAGLQSYLASQGKLVFGCRNGDRLERDRKFFKQTLLDVGLPIIPFDGKQIIKEVKGFDEIRQMLMQTKDKYLKFSDLRGMGETRYHADYATSEEWLFEFTHIARSQRHTFPVIFEDSIKTPDTVEIGGELYHTQGKYLSLGLFGIEDKDASYSCHIISPDEMPKLVQGVHDRMLPIFKQFDVRSVVATEMRCPDKYTAYFNDITMRHPCPPYEILLECWDNLPEIYRAIAAGEDVTPKQNAKHAASVVINSLRVQNEDTPVSFPEKYNDRVKLQNYCIDANGTHICIPQDKGEVLGLVVGLSNDSLEEAQMEALEIAESIKAEGISFMADTFDRTDEKIEKARKLGVWVK